MAWGQVLLVDDEEMLSHALRRYLRPLGVQAVSTGEAALALMEQEPFSVVLVDMSLKSRAQTEWPSGVVLSRELLRRHPELAGRLYLFTAYGPDDARVRETGLPALSKCPQDLSLLKAQLTELVAAAGDAPPPA
jgi:DNA-binding NarL/FixJ family response regulator